jgi:CheY-like chemotaxis protein
MSTDVEQACAPTVLVVDNDADVVELLRLALSGDGYEVSSAANGREALDYLRSHDGTCVILLELDLPVMDGAAFCAVQRRDRSLAWIPVVAMSAAVDGRRKARELGARRFLPKPLDLDRVRAAVSQLSLRPSSWHPYHPG